MTDTNETASTQTEWTDAGLQRDPSVLERLRLTATSGGRQAGSVVARRAAVVELLADGRPHTREDICARVVVQLDRPCWGKRPHEALWRDIKALRHGGIRIAYSRRPGVVGYYLQHPPLEQPPTTQYERINWEHVAGLRRLSVAAKNELAFTAADFALQQKMALAAEQHPDWTPEMQERLARKQVFGVDVSQLTPQVTDSSVKQAHDSY